MVPAPFCRRLFRLGFWWLWIRENQQLNSKVQVNYIYLSSSKSLTSQVHNQEAFSFSFFSPQSIFEIPSTLRIEFLLRKYFVVLILLKSYRIPFAGLDSWISTGISAIRPSKPMHLQVYVLFLPSPRLTTSLPSWILSTLISPILFFMLFVSCHLHSIFYVYRITVLWSPQLKYLIPNIFLFNYIFS